MRFALVVIGTIVMTGCLAENYCESPGSSEPTFRGEPILVDWCEDVVFGCSNDSAVCYSDEIGMVLLLHKGHYRKCGPTAETCNDDLRSIERWCDQNPKCAW